MLGELGFIRDGAVQALDFEATIAMLTLERCRQVEQVFITFLQNHWQRAILNRKT